MESVKILFKLEQDEDGYPPVTVEGLWATRLADDTVEVDSIPFFVRDTSLGDVVRVELIEEELFFASTVIPNCTKLLEFWRAERVATSTVWRRWKGIWAVFPDSLESEQNRITQSMNSTYRLLVTDVEQVEEVRHWLHALGCDSEQSHIPRLIAVNIPDHVDMRILTSSLDDQSAKGVFEFEEAALRGTLAEL
jgi:Domain of unknown function (DUF4265)